MKAEMSNHPAKHDSGVVNKLSAACKQRNEEFISRLCQKLNENPSKLVLILTESLNRMLTSGDSESAYFLLRQKDVSDVKHPYIDYTRVVTLLLVGEYEFAESYLAASLTHYSNMSYLLHLKKAIEVGIDPKLLVI